MLSNISSFNGNHSMTFASLIEYNMKNSFLEKPYTKCDRETTSRPFFEKMKIELISESIV